MMQRFLKVAVMAATVFGTGEMVQAQSRPDAPLPECRQKDRNCPPAPGKEKHHKEQRPGDARGKPPIDDARRGDDLRRPAPDQSPRDARREPPAEMRGMPPRGEQKRDVRHLQRAEGRRLAPAPKGQEYRVIRDQLVLVDKKSKRILSVVGPAQQRR